MNITSIQVIKSALKTMLWLYIQVLVPCEYLELRFALAPLLILARFFYSHARIVGS
jgi:hypothetical protein